MNANEAMVRVCHNLCERPVALPILLETMLGICELARAEGRQEASHEAKALFETIAVLERARG